MASTNICWGIEVGASAVKALKLERTGDTEVRVLDFAVVPHPRVLSTPGTDAAEVIRVSLGALAGQVDLTKSLLAVSVPGHSSFARFTKLPPVEPKKVPDIVRFEAMQQIPFPLEEVEWDYQTFVAPDSPDVSVGIFAIRKDNVRDRLQLLGDFGLTPGVLTLSPLAVYNALAYDLGFDEKTPGTIIVDVGTTSTDIVIAEPGRMWVRTFPMGGHQFTDALVTQFNLSYPKAEKLKREAEETAHARQVFQAMRPVFTDLATEVQRSIGYYQALHKDAKLERLVGVGSTFRLPGLRKYFKQQLSLEVYRVEEFKRISAPEGSPPERVAGFNDAALNLCTAYGLCLQALELNACGGNLMPVSVMRESLWRSKRGTFAAAAGLAVAASAAMFARPAFDYFAIKGKQVDPGIQGAISAAGQEKQKAQEAGVIGSASADMRAAHMIDLLSGKQIYAMLFDDLGQMFKRADEAASKGGAKLDGPALALVKYETTYEPPDGAPDPTAPPGASGAGGEKVPRVRCVLEATTGMPEPRRFVQDTLERWIREHAERPGVPYKLVVVPGSFTVREEKSASAGAPEAGDAGPSGGGPGVMGGGRGGGRTPGGGGGRMGGGGGGRDDRGPGPGAGEVDDSQAATNVSQMAPLGTKAPAVGSATIKMEWTAVLVPAAPGGGA